MLIFTFCVIYHRVELMIAEPTCAGGVNFNLLLHCPNERSFLEYT